MIQNYLKLSLRNLKINRAYTIANIIGLAAGLAAGILVMLCVMEEYSYDNFHKKLGQTYLLMQHQTHGGEVQTGGATPAPLAEKLRSEFSEIEYVTRLTGGRQLLRNKEKSFDEPVIYTDPAFFNIMSFPTVVGNPIAALRDPGSVVITARLAQKLFGNEDPMGQTLQYNNTHDLKVAAVLQDLPENSTIKFDVALPFGIFEQENTKLSSQWDANFLETWVAVLPGTDITAFNQKLDKILADAIHEQTVLFAQPFEKVHLYNRFVDGKPAGGMIYIVWMLSLIGIFIILIACINFMNLSTARSERRAKEVGVRKVMGGRRNAIIGQFLSEAFVTTFLALALGVFLAKLALPLFNAVLDKNLRLDFSQWQLWSALLTLGFFTGLVAGSYPAFFLSAFQPIQVLKGNVTNGKGGLFLRRGLVGFQFFISVFLIICTIVIFRQQQYVQNRPLGYALENLVEIPVKGDMAKKFEVLENDLIQIPGVNSVSAGTDDLLRFGSTVTGIEWPGKAADQDFPITITHVQYDWVKTAGLNLEEGRDFSRDFGADSLACLLNETCVARMGLSEPIGKMLGNKTQVVGVVKDFVYNDPTSDPAPMIVYLDTQNASHFFVRIQNNENWQKSLAQIEQAVRKHNPDIPCDIHFSKDEYQRKFVGMRRTSQMVSLFGGLAILIAGLGLFGLSAFVAERRKKEMGIRKVMGATAANVWLALSRDFFKPVLFGFICSAPIAFWTMNMLLQTLDYRIELSGWIFALAGAITLGVALLTVSFQSVRAALANPVNSLRSE